MVVRFPTEPQIIHSPAGDGPGWGVFRLGAERRLTQGVRLANRRGRRPCRPGPDEALSTVLGEGQHHGNDCLQRRGTRQPLDRWTSAQRDQALLRDQAAAARETSFWREYGGRARRRCETCSTGHDMTLVRHRALCCSQSECPPVVPAGPVPALPLARKRKALLTRAKGIEFLREGHASFSEAFVSARAAETGLHLKGLPRRGRAQSLSLSPSLSPLAGPVCASWGWPVCALCFLCAFGAFFL